VHNVLAGSVSFAIPGPKQMHNASTAQEVTIITPTAKNFEFRVCVLPHFNKDPSQVMVFAEVE
jgi:hypothetical protein